MESAKRIACLFVIAAAAIAVLLPDSADAQVPVITYYSQPVTPFSPVVPGTVVYRPTTVYSVPTTTYYAPRTAYYSAPPTMAYSVPTTTVYSVPAPVVVQPAAATVVYDNGPLGLGLFPRRRVFYSPGYVVAPATPLAFPTTGVVYGGP